MNVQTEKIKNVGPRPGKEDPTKKIGNGKPTQAKPTPVATPAKAIATPKDVKPVPPKEVAPVKEPAKANGKVKAEPKPTPKPAPKPPVEAKAEPKKEVPKKLSGVQILLGCIRQAGPKGLTKDEVMKKLEGKMPNKNPQTMIPRTLDPYLINKGLIEKKDDRYIIRDKKEGK